MAKKIIGDSACPGCRARGGDATGNHLMHFHNTETEEKWVKCGRCGFYEVLDAGNTEKWNGAMNDKVERSPEEIAAALAEVAEYPFKELRSRAITLAVAERFGVRVAVDERDGETPVYHYYPKTVEGEIVGYKVRNLEHKSFWAVGKGSGTDFFGIQQAQSGDVWTQKLFIFEDELSAMSGFQVLVQHSNTTLRPACVSLPDGASSAASVIARNRVFVERFKDIVICMDNDEAGEEAVTKIRAMLPHVKVARIPKGKTKAGKDIKDANDLLMEGRGLELANALRYNAAKESPAGSSTVADCLEDALKKPEWGLSYPWPGLTELTFGLRYGDVIAVGGGVGGG